MTVAQALPESQRPASGWQCYCGPVLESSTAAARGRGRAAALQSRVCRSDCHGPRASDGRPHLSSHRDFRLATGTPRRAQVAQARFALTVKVTQAHWQPESQRLAAPWQCCRGPALRVRLSPPDTQAEA